MPLFADLEECMYPNVLRCLEARVATFEKGQVIYGTTDRIDRAGIIIDGKVNLTFFNEAGIEHNIRQYEKGSLFGETYACLLKKDSNVQIASVTPTKILFIKVSKLFTGQVKICPLASQVTLNLLKEVALENIYLNQKVELLAQKRIREKIKIYLKYVYSNDSVIKHSFIRQEMANFLGVDRSALTRELSFMRAEGIIDFNKYTITVLDQKFIE